MPTIDRFGNFRVVIYPNDHEPAHVHVIGSDGELIINLLLRGGTALREIRGRVSKAEVKRAFKHVEQHREAYLEHWRKIHGE